jgi:hypothetical protein
LLQAVRLPPLLFSSRACAENRELAHSASQIELTRPWREQITTRDREKARDKLGEAERASG